MHAIIQTGSKQYRVAKGDIIEVEKLSQETGSTVSFDVVLCGDKVGSPFVKEVSVKAEVLGEAKGPKVVSYKYKKRKNYRRKVGHRQKYTRVKIQEIGA